MKFADAPPVPSEPPQKAKEGWAGPLLALGKKGKRGRSGGAQAVGKVLPPLSGQVFWACQTSLKPAKG